MNLLKNKNKLHARKFSFIQRKIGKAPGTITYLGNREGMVSKITVLEYGPDIYQLHSPDNLEEILVHKGTSSVKWINVVGISDEELIGNLGAAFNLNPLVLEDTVHTNQRPKIDEYEDYIFGVFKMVYVGEDHHLIGEHVALVLMPDSVIVFQELEEDVFDGLRSRIQTQTGRIRANGADYLFFALIDGIIDNYFVVLESLSDRIEELEAEVYEQPTPETAYKIQRLKKDVLKIRKWVFPLRELVNRLIDTENTLITRDTKLYLRDAMDHSIEINESLQIYREMSMSLLEMYMSNVSNKMNEVMKVLTIMASIFIPLTFLAGIYGMNFEHMPELQWKYGYFVLLAVMVVIFVLMLIYFKKKRWL